MVDIRFGDLRIGHISGNSGVFAGDNRLTQFRHASKHNQAFGSVTGKRSLLAEIHSVANDRDRIDTLKAGRQETR
jgi:hypothetical protein